MMLRTLYRKGAQLEEALPREHAGQVVSVGAIGEAAFGRKVPGHGAQQVVMNDRGRSNADRQIKHQPQPAVVDCRGRFRRDEQRDDRAGHAQRHGDAEIAPREPRGAGGKRHQIERWQHPLEPSLMAERDDGRLLCQQVRERQQPPHAGVPIPLCDHHDRQQQQEQREQRLQPMQQPDRPAQHDREGVTEHAAFAQREDHRHEMARLIVTRGRASVGQVGGGRQVRAQGRARETLWRDGMMRARAGPDCATKRAF